MDRFATIGVDADAAGAGEHPIQRPEAIISAPEPVQPEPVMRHIGTDTGCKTMPAVAFGKSRPPVVSPVTATCHPVIRLAGG